MPRKKKPTRISTRKQQIAAEIERQRNAEVIHVNEPNPVLMQIAMEKIVEANLRTLEAELFVSSPSSQA